MAGILFGFLACESQLALVMPVALLVRGQWRAILAAALTVAPLVGITSLPFAADLWLAFAASTETSRRLLLKQGDVGPAKLQSAFAAVRLWGGGIKPAYAVQGAATVAAVCGVAWTGARRRATATSRQIASSSRPWWRHHTCWATTS